jgi:hypothetical protein
MPLDPLAATDFVGTDEQQQYLRLKKLFPVVAGRLLRRAAQLLAANVAACDERGCTQGSCPLHRGCIVMTAQALSEHADAGDSTAQAAAGPDSDISHADAQQAAADSALCTMEWYSLIRLLGSPETSCSSRLLRTLLTYDRHTEACIMLLIPPHLLARLVRRQLSGASISVLGFGTVRLDRLDQCLVRQCFGLVAPLLPPDVMTVEGHMLPLDPTDLNKLPAAPPGFILDQTLHGTWDASGGPPQLTSGADCRGYLQRTVNRFWGTADSLHDRLAARARKMRCRGMCSGASGQPGTCDVCRGAMVFTVSAPEGPGGQAWQYELDGQSFSSAAPKQYMRGVWRTPSELVRVLGCQDMQLLRTVLQHDRQLGEWAAAMASMHCYACQWQRCVDYQRLPRNSWGAYNAATVQGTCKCCSSPPSCCITILHQQHRLIRQ